MSRIDTRLVERGGLGLVQYHLARHGLPFELTGPNSISGDVWVLAPKGLVKVEVKTALRDQWLISPEQAEKVDIVMFVNLQSAKIYVLTKDEALAAMAHQRAGKLGNKIVLTPLTLPHEAISAFYRFGCPPLSAGPSAATKARRERRPKVVKYRKADGTVKIYTYSR